MDFCPSLFIFPPSIYFFMALNSIFPPTSNPPLTKYKLFIYFCLFNPRSHSIVKIYIRFCIWHGSHTVEKAYLDIEHKFLHGHCLFMSFYLHRTNTHMLSSRLFSTWNFHIHKFFFLISCVCACVSSCCGHNREKKASDLSTQRHKYPYHTCHSTIFNSHFYCYILHLRLLLFSSCCAAADAVMCVDWE